MPSKRENRKRITRRVSLRTLVDRVASSRREATRRASAKPSASGTRRTRVAKRQSSLAPRTVVVGTLCVVAAAALVMSRQSSIVNWVAEVDASGNVQRVERVDAFDPATSTAAAAPDSQARLIPASLRTTEREPEPAVPSPSGDEAAAAESAAAESATISGCLERDEDTFWLKNVSGDEAPKSRSWKSGFLRKKSSNVELIHRGDLTNRLTTYVGRRIETTGTLADHEMRVKSLRVLGSCE